MEIAILVMTHIIALAGGYAFGKINGFNDAQPERDTKGRFRKKD